MPSACTILIRGNDQIGYTASVPGREGLTVWGVSVDDVERDMRKQLVLSRTRVSMVQVEETV